MYTLSIILNLHREGDIALKTIQNLKNIIAYAKRRRNWKAIEVIAILDRADAKTYTIAAENEDFFSRIETVDFGDPALSRNRGVELSKHNFISFADGDDYVSHNALVKLYKAFCQHYSTFDKPLGALLFNEHIALFPEWIAVYPKFYFLNYCNSNNHIIKNMLFKNSYPTRISCHKTLLIKSPYQSNDPPYGYEDWDLHNRLLSLGVQYRVVKNYIYFYREKTDSSSVFYTHNEKKRVVRNSALYNYRMLENHPDDDQNSSQKKHIHIINQLKQKKICESLVKMSEEFLSAYGEIDLIASKKTIERDFKIDANSISLEYDAYKTVCNFLKNKSVVLFIPWIALGGADFIIIQFVRSLISRSISVGLIVTIKPGERIHEADTDYLVLNTLPNWHCFNDAVKTHIVLKALINSHPLKAVHFIQSDFGFKLLKYYSSVLKEKSIKIISSLFSCYHDREKNEYFGYPTTYPEIFKNSDIVLCDNQHWHSYFKKLNNQEDFSFRKLFTPAEATYNYLKLNRSDTKKILWASRICTEKLFNVLSEIIHRMPRFIFILYGGMPEGDVNLNLLKKLIKLPNVLYRGAYQKVYELDFSEFDLFLYTSFYDGLPHVVIEMAKIGIPMVVANVGGVTEVLREGYSLLVEDVTNPLAYIEKINEFYLPHVRLQVQRQLTEIQQNTTESHNFEKFSQDYLDSIDIQEFSNRPLAVNTITLDYPISPKQRWTEQKPHKKLKNIINSNRNIYKKHLSSFLDFKNYFIKIPSENINNLIPHTPCWINGWMPALDSVALYSFLALYKPKRYMEVGSGNSTLFAHRAITDHKLNTKIISIDPKPRSEIDFICDEVIRQPVEDIDLEFFDQLEMNDILYVDNSHQVFMNSDVTTIFLDVIPRLKSGVFVEIHDITLPLDYPAEWTNRYYSEQYLLASYLLAEGNKFDIILPNMFISQDNELANILAPLWNHNEMKNVQTHGCSFWFVIN